MKLHTTIILLGYATAQQTEDLDNIDFLLEDLDEYLDGNFGDLDEYDELDFGDLESMDLHYDERENEKIYENEDYLLRDPHPSEFGNKQEEEEQLWEGDFNMKDFEGLEFDMEQERFADDNYEDKTDVCFRDIELEEITWAKNLHFWQSYAAFSKDRKKDPWAGNYPKLEIPDTFKMRMNLYTLKKSEPSKI
jgi:hypothetical protein